MTAVWNARVIGVVVLALVALLPLVGVLIGRAMAARDAQGASPERARALRLNAWRVQLFLPCLIGLVIVGTAAVQLLQGRPLAGVALAATVSVDFAPKGHPATNPGMRGLALALAFLLPALLIAGLLAVVVRRLRGGRIERRRPAVVSGLCAFCVIASALTWWLGLTWTTNLRLPSRRSAPPWCADPAAG